ncbi:MAG: CocE/NonD family hydrolase [Desulfobacterales bacterium]
MKIVKDLPRKVRVIENTWITMPDGIRLAARIWIPEGARKDPVPAVLEYIPYRKRDDTRNRDNANHGYFAGHGYACVRVDIRGSGDSEGVLTGEYLTRELEDGLAILEWIAAQPWCNGSVGMFGISWGGFNGLQIAALKPPQLKAVISVCSTDDRYSDDVHYMGGCMLGDNLSWASLMFARNAQPPDPVIVGDKWRGMWRRRLEESGLWLEDWLRHQRRDEFWKHGSICEDFSAVECPVMAVSGWADGYSNAVFRLLEGLTVPRHGLIGPWSHKYPHTGVPGPAIGFLQECLRWWDRWLKGKENGVEKEPMLRVWILDSIPPRAEYDMRPGRWIAEKTWPSERIHMERYAFSHLQLTPENESAGPGTVSFRSPLRLGLFAGKWCSYAAPPDLPGDQREEDGGALVFEGRVNSFTTEALEKDLEILGAPIVDLELSSDSPVAMVAVRLSDVLPDGPATRVTYGLLNLTHRESHEFPEPLEPGKRYRVRVRLNYIAQTFPRGHRLRISLSTSYWPLAWTPPERTTLTLYIENSTLILPVRPVDKKDENATPVQQPKSAPMEPVSRSEPPERSWRVIRDLSSDVSTLEVVDDWGTYKIKSIGTEVKSRVTESYSIHDDDPDSVKGETYCRREIRRKDWHVATITRTILTSNSHTFRIHAALDAYEREERVFSRNWNKTIPRDLV